MDPNDASFSSCLVPGISLHSLHARVESWLHSSNRQFVSQCSNCPMLGRLKSYPTLLGAAEDHEERHHETQPHRMGQGDHEFGGPFLRASLGFQVVGNDQFI